MALRNIASEWVEQIAGHRYGITCDGLICSIPADKSNRSVTWILFSGPSPLDHYHEPRFAGRLRQPTPSAAANSVLLLGFLSSCSTVLVPGPLGMGLYILFPVLI
jgi:hypothetical protein